MISRFYVHNFRCLENFDLPISGKSSLLLIGQNGTGKTTVGRAFELLQRIARGTNRVGDLVRPKDLSRGRPGVPMRFEIGVKLAGQSYDYSIAFDFPEGFRELRVFEEKLTIDGKIVYTRETSQVRLAKAGQDKEANFRIDWHFVALTIVQHPSSDKFREWLARTVILRPMPSRITGNSEDETLQPDAELASFGAWFSGLLAHAPSAYGQIEQYLKTVMPDFDDIKNPTIGKDSRSLQVQFSNSSDTMSLSFEDLSDGEKCLMIFGIVLAANKAYGPLLCFWDEPDNYLAPFEVGSSVIALRRAFEHAGQLIVTSHNPEAIRRFSDENTLALFRRSHLEPTIVYSLRELRERGDLTGDLVDAIVRGDVGNGR